MDVRVEDLQRDPYPTYAQLRANAPLAWIAPLKMWWVTRYEAARQLMLDDVHFTTVSPRSPVMDAFGPQMLSSDGADHVRYRTAAQGALSPRAVRDQYAQSVARLAGDLLAPLRPLGAADLRRAFASRLPVQVMLEALSLPLGAEGELRAWYDVFEARLADPHGDPDISRHAKAAAAAFRRRAGAALPHPLEAPALPAVMTTALATGALTLEEAERNLSVIVFGGISTVEALILNTLYALFTHPDVAVRVRAAPELLPAAVEETMRWMSPVQSATRFVARDTVFMGVALEKGQKISAMLGAANRDPEVFDDPDAFRIDRPNARRQLGFATGPHLCLGLHLARAQAATAVGAVLEALPDLEVDVGASAPEGFEFRQPKTLHARWAPPV